MKKRMGEALVVVGIATVILTSATNLDEISLLLFGVVSLLGIAVSIIGCYLAEFIREDEE